MKSLTPKARDNNQIPTVNIFSVSDRHAPHVLKLHTEQTGTTLESADQSLTGCEDTADW
jgi:hypothetical protein